jgi:signal transduction histidine kinase
VEHELRIAQAQLEDRVKERTAELNAANASLRELPGRLLKTQDQERRRIARELHDGIGQYLAGLKFQIHHIERLAKENSEPSPELLSETSGTVDHCISEVRTISHLLHPPLLDELGLLSAIRWYAEGFSKRSGVTASLELPEVSSRFPEGVELALFRVLQESLTNVHRHSGCSSVTVRLEASEKELNLWVKDNGRGIPEDRIRRFHEQGTGFGVGIAGMQERMRELGGQLTISSDRSGTTVVATIPLIAAAQIRIAKSVSAGHSS